MIAAWQNLSLRLRLTFLYVGLLTFLLIALGSFLYFDTQSYLISSTVLRLQNQSQLSTERVFRVGGPGPAPGPRPLGSGSPPNLSQIAGLLARSQTSAETTAAVIDQGGKLLADGRTLPEQPVSAPPDQAMLADALSGKQGIYYITDVSGQHTLVLLIPLHGSGPNTAVTGVLQLSSRLDLVDEVLGRERLLIIGGVLITLILGTVGGIALTGSALAPLRWMVVTCRRIAAGDLSQRVNLPHRRDEIGQLAASFDDMVERLDETFAAQRQFIADASHELRTPLTAIAGTLDVLLLAPEDDPEISHRMLTRMRRELARLTRLVVDLLTLNRLDAHQGLRLQSVDLASLAREVAEQIKPIAAGRSIEIETSGDTLVQGDPDRLKQVLLNLADNSIRFTDAERGVIRVQVCQADKAVRFSFWDNGAGIPPEIQSHLFERFYRADKARTRALADQRSGAGTGLGLAIVKAIVEAHHGTVSRVKSSPVEGTLFEFTIPKIQ